MMMKPHPIDSWITLIPARRQSLRLPGKNKSPLCGKPLIAYTLETALANPITRNCVVSTDDPEIMEIARSYGIAVQERPASLALQGTPSEAVMEYFLKTEGLNTGALILLQPTSPLRSLQHIAQSTTMFEKGIYDSLISMRACQPDDPVRYVLEDDLLHPAQGAAGQPHYTPNGAIYIVRNEIFLSTKTIYHAPCAGYVMDDLSSLDIDTQEDLSTAEEALMSRG